MTLRATLARNLRRLRNERGLSQEQLAFESDVDRGYVGHLEREKYSASLDILEKLASALKVDPISLLVDVGRQKKPR